MQTTRREIAADNFFTGIFETALDRTEIVTAVRLPKPQAACYMKFKNPASRYAIVGVFVAHTSPQTWSGAAHTTQFIHLQRGTLYSPLAAANGCAVDSVDDPPPGSILDPNRGSKFRAD